MIMLLIAGIILAIVGAVMFALEIAFGDVGGFAGHRAETEIPVLPAIGFLIGAGCIIYSVINM